MNIADELERLVDLRRISDDSSVDAEISERIADVRGLMLEREVFLRRLNDFERNAPHLCVLVHAALRDFSDRLGDLDRADFDDDDGFFSEVERRGCGRVATLFFDPSVRGALESLSLLVFGDDSFVETSTKANEATP